MSGSNTKHTPQHIENMSFDERMGMAGRVVYGYDDGNDGTRRVAVDQNGRLEVAVVSAPTYEGAATEATLADVKANTAVDGPINTTLDGLDTKLGTVRDTQADVLAELEKKANPDEPQIAELIPMLRNILLAIANPSYVDKSANAIRNQVQSGTITTVTTVTGITNLGSYSADHLQRQANLTAWATNVRSLIS